MKGKLFFLLFTASCGISLWLTLSDGGIFTYIAQRKTIKKLEDKIHTLEENIKELERKIKLMRAGDREFIENLLRQEGWIKEGERVVIFKDFD